MRAQFEILETVASLADRLERGEVASLDLAETCLERIGDPGGEGASTFIAVDAEAVRAQAERVDALRRAGATPSGLAGIPISVKGLFDVAGMVTTAGSKVLASQPPAPADAEAVARLKAAGLVVTGHTNMSEFAYSGLGLNPHYGTPRNPADRAVGRVPGGSSSGAAVSVTDGMSAVALGTDTGGSCRVPAAFCGLAGFRPTARRMPTGGMFPLSPTLDAAGVIAPSADCCARIDAVLAGERWDGGEATEGSELRLAVLETYVMEDVSPAVAEAFERALALFAGAGAEVQTLRLPELQRLTGLNDRGGIVAAEAWAGHRERLAEHEALYDRRVSARIRRGGLYSEADYQGLLRARAEIIAATALLTRGFDAVVFPTTPFQAPTIGSVSDDDVFVRTNLLALRNSTMVNFLDRCAISVPIPMAPGELPVGLTLMGETMGDRRLLSVAIAVEAALAGSR